MRVRHNGNIRCWAVQVRRGRSRSLLAMSLRNGPLPNLGLSLEEIREETEALLRNVRARPGARARAPGTKGTEDTARRIEQHAKDLDFVSEEQRVLLVRSFARPMCMLMVCPLLTPRHACARVRAGLPVLWQGVDAFVPDKTLDPWQARGVEAAAMHRAQASATSLHELESSVVARKHRLSRASREAAAGTIQSPTRCALLRHLRARAHLQVLTRWAERSSTRAGKRAAGWLKDDADRAAAERAQWREVHDPETGDVWWHNSVTGQSQWEVRCCASSPARLPCDASCACAQHRRLPSWTCTTPSRMAQVPQVMLSPRTAELATPSLLHRDARAAALISAPRTPASGTAKRAVDVSSLPPLRHGWVKDAAEGDPLADVKPLGSGRQDTERSDWSALRVDARWGAHALACIAAAPALTVPPPAAMTRPALHLCLRCRGCTPRPRSPTKCWLRTTRASARASQCRLHSRACRPGSPAAQDGAATTLPRARSGPLAVQHTGIAAPADGRHADADAGAGARGSTGDGAVHAPSPRLFLPDGSPHVNLRETVRAALTRSRFDSVASLLADGAEQVRSLALQPAPPCALTLAPPQKPLARSRRPSARRLIVQEEDPESPLPPRASPGPARKHRGPSRALGAPPAIRDISHPGMCRADAREVSGCAMH